MTSSSWMTWHKRFSTSASDPTESHLADATGPDSGAGRERRSPFDMGTRQCGVPVNPFATWTPWWHTSTFGASFSFPPGAHPPPVLSFHPARTHPRPACPRPFLQHYVFCVMNVAWPSLNLIFSVRSAWIHELCAGTLCCGLNLRQYVIYLYI